MIRDDPNDMSGNGQILSDILNRNNLYVLNSDILCTGTITRHRVTKKSLETSILDYIIVCDILKAYFEEMIIDEDRTHVLTKYASTKGCHKNVESDHNILYSRFAISYRKTKPKTVREIFNLKNEANQAKFFEATCNTNKFTGCFEDANTNLEKKSSNFFKALNGSFYQCFDKIRITNKPGGMKAKDDVQYFMDRKAQLQDFLKTHKSQFSKSFADKEIIEINSKISSLISKRNVQIVTSQLSELETLEGGFSQIGMWKLKSKLFPKPPSPPMAKKDKYGNFITNQGALKDLYLETYTERLKHRQIKEEFEDIFKLKSLLWKKRLSILKTVETRPWTPSDLDKVIKTLKRNLSIDPNNMINEIFLLAAMGSNLKSGLLKLMNEIKSEMIVPYNLQLSNISSIYKNNSKSQFELINERGIFILPVARKILDKLLYLDNTFTLTVGCQTQILGLGRIRI